MKQCSSCGMVMPDTSFYTYKSGVNSGHLLSRCIICSKKCWLQWKKTHPGYHTQHAHAIGRKRPMNEAKDCALYLGVHIAERALSNFFDNIQRMPTNNPGYDFICGKGFKIDVKSSCKHHSTGSTWQFDINKNRDADYFLCLAFDNRENLEPQHVWLIPGSKINDRIGIGISNTTRSLHRWQEYEKRLDKVIERCGVIRSEGE